MDPIEKRSSNHSIDRFLLVLLLRRFYRNCLIFLGKQKDLRILDRQWTSEEEERWDTGRILTPPLLARAMNIWLYNDDAGQLRLENGARLSELKKLMTIQYASNKELDALRAQRQAFPRTEVGIQRKTVANLLRELLLFEERLTGLADPDQADAIAGCVQGFRLQPCFPQECGAKGKLFRVNPVGQPAHDLAAVQAAYYPFLDQTTTAAVLDRLLLSNPQRQTLDEVAEGKESPLYPSLRNALPEVLGQALAAAQEVQACSVMAETGETSAEPFWYELRYHSWQWVNQTLQLVPRSTPIPILPWQVVYSNGYFYLCGLRLDLDPTITGGKHPEKGLVFSNLRLDRISDFVRVAAGDGLLDHYSFRDLHALSEALGNRFAGSMIEYRNASTIMYSGKAETLLIDCHKTLMNSAVDDFGRENLSLDFSRPPEPDWVRIRVKDAVWAGARQWLLQHTGACRLASVPKQSQKCQELAQMLMEAAHQYHEMPLSDG